ncbi:MAG TPA: GntR family transcriptional regulator [Acidiferrobacterales bacterium]|nr:GntR family transcriptional regulator [Acidiferrobacterales bacterium]
MNITEISASGRKPLIDRRTLHDEVVGRLRDMIIEGELSPGTRLTERILCQRFGISRTPLREAVKVLASEGLLELLPNRGAAVTELTIEAVEDMFQVIGALEALAGELACARISDEDLAEIRALHYQMLAHHARSELSEYFKYNQRIHEKIIEAAKNPILANTYRSLSGRIRRARYLANFSKERWDHAVHEHNLILEALTKKEAGQLRQLLQDHLRNKLEVVKATIISRSNG